MRHQTYDEMAIPYGAQELLPTMEGCTPLPLPFPAAECHGIFLSDGPQLMGETPLIPHVVIPISIASRAYSRAHAGMRANEWHAPIDHNVVFSDV